MYFRSASLYIHTRMISLLRPGTERIASFAEAQRTAPFSYAEVGATRGELPRGYHVDRSEEPIGRGEGDFARASAALAGLRHYDGAGGRIRVVEPRPELAEGAVVVLLGCHLGIWTLSACRVVYVFDEPSVVRLRVRHARARGER